MGLRVNIRAVVVDDDDDVDDDEAGFVEVVVEVVRVVVLEESGRENIAAKSVFGVVNVGFSGIGELAVGNTNGLRVRTLGVVS